MPATIAASPDIALSNDIVEEKVAAKAERSGSFHEHDKDYYGSKKRRLTQQKSFGSEMIKLSFTDLTYTVPIKSTKEEIKEGAKPTKDL